MYENCYALVIPVIHLGKQVAVQQHLVASNKPY